MRLISLLIVLFTSTICYGQSVDITGQDPNNSNLSIGVRSQSSEQIADAQQAQQDAINNKPENKFNKDQFDGQLGQTNLATNPSLLTMVGALDRFIDFKNFQAIANVIVAMFKGGELSRDDVDTFLSVMENQQINLETYNGELIDNSTN